MNAAGMVCSDCQTLFDVNTCRFPKVLKTREAAAKQFTAAEEFDANLLLQADQVQVPNQQVALANAHWQSDPELRKRQLELLFRTQEASVRQNLNKNARIKAGDQDAIAAENNRKRLRAFSETPDASHKRGEKQKIVREKLKSAGNGTLTLTDAEKASNLSRIKVDAGMNPRKSAANESAWAAYTIDKFLERCDKQKKWWESLSDTSFSNT